MVGHWSHPPRALGGWLQNQKNVLCLSFKKGFYFIDKINDYIYIVKPTRDEKSKGPFFVENLQNLSELINDNIVIE